MRRFQCLNCHFFANVLIGHAPELIPEGDRNKFRTEGYKTPKKDTQVLHTKCFMAVWNEADIGEAKTAKAILKKRWCSYYWKYQLGVGWKYAEMIQGREYLKRINSRHFWLAIFAVFVAIAALALNIIIGTIQIRG